MGIIRKDLFDAGTGEKAGSRSRLTGSVKTDTKNFFTDKKLVDKRGNHVATEPSIIKDSASAVIGITAGIVSIFAAFLNKDE
jgi:hypothetical protein